MKEQQSRCKTLLIHVTPKSPDPSTAAAVTAELHADVVLQ